jgi:progressive ankylosis protein
MQPDRPLRLREIFAFWAPLAATWLMMAVEGPYLAAIIARLPDPKFNLAAYGVAFAFAIIVEAPVIMMMSASTALVSSRLAFRRLRNFGMALNAQITLAMLVILIPAVYDWLFLRLIGLDPEVARLTRVSLWILLPWPAAIGYRRFYQGVLIRHGLTRRVAYGTVSRVVAMSLTAWLLYHFANLPGAWVGAAALSMGVCVEASFSRLMVGEALEKLDRLPPDADAGAPGYREIWNFYLPLAMTATLTMGIQPMVTFFMGQARFSLESLAVLPVIGSLVFIFRAPGISYQEAAISLMERGETQHRPVHRFALLLGTLLVSALALLAFTPLSRLWFEGVSGLTTDLADFARPALRILVPMAGFSVLLALQRAILVLHRRTGPVTGATVLEVIVVGVILFVTIRGFDLPGAVAAASALLGGRMVSALVLVIATRRIARSQ